MTTEKIPAAEKIGSLTAYIEMIRWQTDHARTTAFFDRDEHLDRLDELLTKAETITNTPTDWSK